MNAVLKGKGYDIVTTPAQMLASKSSKIWGSFSKVNLAYDMDRDPSKEPSLSEMTRKAIEILSKNPNGFFLMVEGSKIDWAAHANDTIGIITDTLAFDAAVKVALDYAKQSGEVSVLASTDHGNSGLSIGSSTTNADYNKRPVSDFIDPLKKAKRTIEGTMGKFATMLLPDRSNVDNLAGTWYGLTDLTADEKTALAGAAKVADMGPMMVAMLAKRANLAYTTTGHTGEDVVLYSWSPDGDRLTGTVDNSDMAKYMAKKLGLDLAATTKRLFSDAVKAFTAKGADARLILDKNNGNHLLVVTKGTQTLYLPVNKNEAFIDDRMVSLPGVSVLSGDVFYVSQDAISLIR
jgi:alkaline phosphatase